MLLLESRKVTFALWSVAVDVEREAIQGTAEGVSSRERNCDDVTTLFFHKFDQCLFVLFHDANAWADCENVEMNSGSAIVGGAPTIKANASVNQVPLVLFE